MFLIPGIIVFSKKLIGRNVKFDMGKEGTNMLRQERHMSNLKNMRAQGLPYIA